MMKKSLAHKFYDSQVCSKMPVFIIKSWEKVCELNWMNFLYVQKISYYMSVNPIRKLQIPNIFKTREERVWRDFNTCLEEKNTRGPCCPTRPTRGLWKATNITGVFTTAQDLFLFNGPTSQVMMILFLGWFKMENAPPWVIFSTCKSLKKITFLFQILYF